MFEVEGLQAVDPECLPRDRGVTVFVHAETSEPYGIPLVTLSASTRAALVAYVEDNWGPDPDGIEQYIREVRA